MTSEQPYYPDRGHPDLALLNRVKPCRTLGCTEVIDPMTDMTVRGISGFCRACYDRLTA